MKTGIYFLGNSLNDNNSLEKRKAEVFEGLNRYFTCEKVMGDEFESFDFLLLCVMTGGSESQFVEIYDKLVSSATPFALVAGETHNSLPAAIEILTWLRECQKSEKAVILTGTLEEIAAEASRRDNIATTFARLRNLKFGVIGEPSDWLIASRLDLSVIEKKLGLGYKRISMDEFNEFLSKATVHEKFIEHFSSVSANTTKEELEKSALIYSALLGIKKKYNLNALTLRCFELLGNLSTTGCLALAMLNDQGVPASCEGDVPALISMIIAHELTGSSSFMANPSIIKEDRIVFAHCTAPMAIMKKPSLVTHFESNKGLALRGSLDSNKVTIFKAGGGFMSKYAVAEGKILSHEHDPNLCRTQVSVRLKGAREYFLTHPLGNHHLVIPGWHANTIKLFCDTAGMTAVWQ